MAELVAQRANPAPLGLAGFGLTTVVLSTINAGLVSGDNAALVAVVVPLAFAYGGVAQIIAGLLEFKNGSTFGTVAFISYGLFWWWYALLLWTTGAGWIAAPSGAAVGLTLLMWGVFTFYMWIATFRAAFALWTVFLLLWVTFLLLAAGDLGLGTVWRTLGGWVGLLTGLDAMYVSFAHVANEAFGRPVVPLGNAILK
jgi:succinate-acetate transporter protein